MENKVETTENNNNGNNHYKEFEIRHHQIETEIAMELQVTDLLKDTKDNDEQQIAISKADIILIFSIYKGGMIEFFELYKQYVADCKQRRYRVVSKPHWMLKRLID